MGKKLDIVKWLTLSDLHVPHLDMDYFTWALLQIEDYRPDYLILNGDLYEAAAASRWPSEAKHQLGQEYGQAVDVLKMLRFAAPRCCKLVLNEGNHDANIMAENRIPWELRDVCDPAYNKHLYQELTHWNSKFTYINNPKHCTFKLGQVHFHHGFKAGQTSDNVEGIEHGDEWGLVVRGHTHRPKAVTQCKGGAAWLHRWYANSGCGVKLDPVPTYVQRNNHQQWGHAIVKGEAALLKSPRKGRYWEAETVIRRMAWDDGTPWKSKLGEIR